MPRCNLQTVSVTNSDYTYSRSTLSLLRVRSVLASLVQAAADGKEEDQWHDEIRHLRNVTGGFIENIFQPQR